MDALEARIAFSMLNGINLATGRELLRRMGSIEAVFEADEQQMASVLGRKGGIASEELRRGIVRRAATEAAFVRSSNIRALFFTDEDYPRRLLECEDAPALVYTAGTTPLNNLRSVAIVGTRHCTAYGQDFTRRLVEELAEAYGKNIAIVSGLAYGVDVAAHKAALKAGLPTVGVMANALNTVYPAEHRDVAARIVRQGGMLMSEYSTDTRVHRGFFLARNRIVAGLADAVVVVESDLRGGAMSTARIAVAYGRELFAVPGRATDVYSRGCLDLLASRMASVVRGADDIAEALGWPRQTEGRQQELLLDLSPVQQSLVDHLRNHPEATVNDICVALGMSYASLSSQLFELEMADVIMTVPGGRYAVLDR
ncbi:MAG: DNA-processing protein DprA [Muribaculaceae bacterium]|nr:DNA-processing protein DprA [Muribaculaceae bacterium]